MENPVNAHLPQISYYYDSSKTLYPFVAGLSLKQLVERRQSMMSTTVYFENAAREQAHRHIACIEACIRILVATPLVNKELSLKIQAEQQTQSDKAVKNTKELNKKILNSLLKKRK